MAKVYPNCKSGEKLLINQEAYNDLKEMGENELAVVLDSSTLGTVTTMKTQKLPNPIVVVENDDKTFDLQKERIATKKYENITHVKRDIFDYLDETKANIGFLFLDLMSANLSQRQMKIINNTLCKIASITLAVRCNTGHKNRRSVRARVNQLKRALTNYYLDRIYGYRRGEGMLIVSLKFIRGTSMPGIKESWRVQAVSPPGSRPCVKWWADPEPYWCTEDEADTYRVVLARDKATLKKIGSELSAIYPN